MTTTSGLQSKATSQCGMKVPIRPVKPFSPDGVNCFRREASYEAELDDLPDERKTWVDQGIYQEPMTGIEPAPSAWEAEVPNCRFTVAHSGSRAAESRET